MSAEIACDPPAGLPDDVITRLESVISSRRDADPAQSYVASLITGDPDQLLKKVIEEATEVVLAAKQPDNQPLCEEAADLLFHLVLLLSSRGIAFHEVLGVLERREGLSGLQEKQLRSPVKSR